MLLFEALQNNLLTAPSWKRWLASQHIRARILTPIVATRGDVRIEIDLVQIVSRINAAGVN